MTEIIMNLNHPLLQCSRAQATIQLVQGFNQIEDYYLL